LWWPAEDPDKLGVGQEDHRRSTTSAPQNLTGAADETIKINAKSPVWHFHRILAAGKYSVIPWEGMPGTLGACGPAPACTASTRTTTGPNIGLMQWSRRYHRCLQCRLPFSRKSSESTGCRPLFTDELHDWLTRWQATAAAKAEEAVWYTRTRLGAWDALTVSMASGWPPDGWVTSWLGPAKSVKLSQVWCSRVRSDGRSVDGARSTA
jgi:hypothetical protein